MARGHFFINCAESFISSIGDLNNGVTNGHTLFLLVYYVDAASDGASPKREHTQTGACRSNEFAQLTYMFV